MILTVINTILFLLAIPFCLGLPFVRKSGGSGPSVPLIFVSGLLCYLGIFQICYVPFVLYYNHFTPLVYVVVILVILLSILSMIKYRVVAREVVARKFSWNKRTMIPWLFVLVIVGFQLYYTIFYQFIDGDDAYYGAFSVIMEYWETMYVHVPYTGSGSAFDVRHGFSGAPVFVAFIARIIGAHPIVVYHVILPVLLVIVMYVVYGMIGSILFQKNPEHVPLFLSIIGLLYIYGNTSIYTAATFALTRTAQGKSIICNLVIPIVFYLILRIGENCKEDRNSKVEFLLLSLATLMGGFCTMLGLVLVPILSGMGLVILAFVYKKWHLLGMQVLALIPSGVLGLLYMCLVY